MKKRKIYRMHEMFGKCEGKRCEDCINLVCGKYHGRILRKCVAYGMTHSEASDWAKSWTACGLFNKSYVGNPIIKITKKNNDEPIDGQISFDKRGDNT